MFKAMRGDHGTAFREYVRTIVRVREVRGFAPKVLSLRVYLQNNTLVESEEITEWLERQTGLKELYLEGIRISSPFTVLGHFQCLHSLNCTVQWTSANDATRLTTALSKGSPLLRIIIINFIPLPAAELEETIPFSTFWPLSRIPKIYILTIDTPSPILLEPAGIADMVKAWPSLRSLSPTSRPGHFQLGRGTRFFASLQALANAFGPKRAHLFHWFVVEDEVPTEIAPAKSGLRVLDVGTSPLSVERAEEIVPFLEAMLTPGVRLKSGPKPQPHLDEEPTEAWAKVSELLFQSSDGK